MAKDQVGPVDLSPAEGTVIGDAGCELYDIWRVKIRVRNRLYGGVPKSEKIIEGWHNERIKKALEAGHKISPEKAEAELKEIKETVTVDEEASWCGFKEFYRGEEVGPYLDGYNFKAMLREGATQTSVTLLRWSNNRGFRQHYQHGIHIKNGTGDSDIILVGEIAGQEEFVGHVKTPQGQKAVLSRYDYVEPGTELEFQVWSLAVGIVDTDLLKTILLTAQEIGIGAARSREMSKFDAVELERLQVGSIPHLEKMAADKKAKAEKAAAKKAAKEAKK